MLLVILFLILKNVKWDIISKRERERVFLKKIKFSEAFSPIGKLL
jgi:hypothetical protein